MSTARSVNEPALREALGPPGALGRCLARHAYGMGVWVDVIGSKLVAFRRPEAKALAARIVADNARHAVLFRAAARSLGADPDAYRCPPEGEAIYDLLSALSEPAEIAAFALGSLDHFAALLAVYGEVAEHGPRAVIDDVARDVEAHRAGLRRLSDGAASSLREEALRLYALRETAEAPGYAAGT